MDAATPRDILAANLRRMVESEAPPGGRPSIRAWSLSRGLDVRMIDRLSKGEHAVTVDKLAEIAKACGLQPWHLLLEDLDPKSPPDAPVTEEDRKMLRKLRKLMDDGE